MGNISLEKDTDCLSVPEDYTLIVSGILSGNDYIAFLGKDHTYAHGNQAKEINGILYGIAVCIFHMGTAHIESRCLSLFLSVWPDTGKSGNVSCCIYTFRSCLEIIVHLDPPVNDDSFPFHTCHSRTDSGSHNDQVTGQFFAIIQNNLPDDLILSHNRICSFSSQIENSSCFFKPLLVFKSRRLVKLYRQDLVCHLYDRYFLSGFHQAIGSVQTYQTGTDDHNILRIFCQLINSLGVS